MAELLWQYEAHLWQMFVLFLVCLLLPMELGLRLGSRHRSRLDGAEAPAHSDVTLPALLALLGLILAFTYSFSLGRADNRKEAVIAEVNAIGTTFMRADLLDEPGRGNLRQALYDYALTRRVEPGSLRSAEDLESVIEDSLVVQARLWPLLTRALREGTLTAPEKTLLVNALTDVLDTHNQLIMAIYDRLPPAVLGLLLLVGGASLGVAGYNAALNGHPARLRMSLFGFILACLMFMILDFDMPQRGFIQVNFGNLDRLIADMRGALAG
jgi:hypothetical protein